MLVVDSYSPDGTATFVRQNYPWVKCLSCKRGVSVQRNYGANLATSPILIFLDADTRLPAKTIHDLMSKFHTKNLTMACPMFLPNTTKVWVWLLFAFLNFLFILSQKVLPSGAGSCLIIRKELFLAHGGFRSVPFEDMELIRRMAKKSKYAILPTKIYVSDRRMQKDGFLKTIAMYAYLCAIFTFGNFRAAAKIKYPFGQHNSTAK